MGTKMDNRIFGYVRVSTSRQKLERQIVTIKERYPDAIIYPEKFTGTTTERPEWKKLLQKVKAGDTIIFDEVSRMSRDAEEGFKTYTELFKKGVELVFIKEPQINTSVYRKALETQLQGVGDEIADTLIDAINKVLHIIQRQQIETAFAAAQKEVDFLHGRISEGMKQAKARGKVVGRETGRKIETKKAREQKAVIRKHAKDFGGSLSDVECIKMTGLARNTFYKYKKEIKNTLYNGL